MFQKRVTNAPPGGESCRYEGLTSPLRHFASNLGQGVGIQQPGRRGKHYVILNFNVCRIEPAELFEMKGERLTIGFRQHTRRQPVRSQSLHLEMVRLRLGVITFQRGHPIQNIGGHGRAGRTQSGKQRLLFIGGVAWRRFAKIAQGRPEGLTLSGIKRNAAAFRCDAHQHRKKPLDPPVTIREESQWLLKGG